MRRVKATVAMGVFGGVEKTRTNGNNPKDSDTANSSCELRLAALRYSVCLCNALQRMRQIGW
jgi:hypothetical protein